MGQPCSHDHIHSPLQARARTICPTADAGSCLKWRNTRRARTLTHSLGAPITNHGPCILNLHSALHGCSPKCAQGSNGAYYIRYTGNRHTSLRRHVIAIKEPPSRRRVRVISWPVRAQILDRELSCFRATAPFYRLKLNGVPMATNTHYSLKNDSVYNENNERKPVVDGGETEELEIKQKEGHLQTLARAEHAACSVAAGAAHSNHLMMVERLPHPTVGGKKQSKHADLGGICC
ncbi:hypothetical protein BJY52DRAFT_1259750 [Lactarius psammicola]|nr:hypothetical protein BJY52DRAFT_1259750 [Lactarius psammicola]